MYKIANYKCNIALNEANTNYLNIEKIDIVEKSTYTHQILIWNNNYSFSSQYLKFFPKLKIFINWGVEDNNIKNEKELLKKGILVKKVDLGSTETLSEYILILILAFERNFLFLSRGEKKVGNELYGKKNRNSWFGKNRI